jgi:adenylate cyclase class 2
MAIEQEIKFLGIDLSEIRAHLQALGADCIEPERLMRRTILDFPDHRLGAHSAWVRVRDEGDRVTMSYKQFFSESLQGMEEKELTIQDYEAGIGFLQAIGLVSRSFQESRRETWEYHGSTITLDTWPWLPAFMEIEGESEEGLRSVVEDLGFSWEDGIYGGIVEVFKRYYDVTSDEVNTIEEICFGSVPAWLEGKRR